MGCYVLAPLRWLQVQSVWRCVCSCPCTRTGCKSKASRRRFPRSDAERDFADAPSAVHFLPRWPALTGMLIRGEVMFFFLCLACDSLPVTWYSCPYGVEETTYGNCTAPGEKVLAQALEPMGDPEGMWPPPIHGSTSRQGGAGMTHGSLAGEEAGMTTRGSSLRGGKGATTRLGKGKVTRGSSGRRQGDGGDSRRSRGGERREVGREGGGGRRDKDGERGEEQAMRLLPRVVREAMGGEDVDTRRG